MRWGNKEWMSKKCSVLDPSGRCVVLLCGPVTSDKYTLLLTWISSFYSSGATKAYISTFVPKWGGNL